MLFLQPQPLPLEPRASRIMNCPFCGVDTDVAHESQEGCIEALNAEIGRMRELLLHVRSAAVPEPLHAGEDDEPPDERRRRDVPS